MDKLSRCNVVYFLQESKQLSNFFYIDRRQNARARCPHARSRKSPCSGTVKMAPYNFMCKNFGQRMKNKWVLCNLKMADLMKSYQSQTWLIPDLDTSKNSKWKSLLMPNLHIVCNTAFSVYMRFQIAFVCRCRWSIRFLIKQLKCCSGWFCTYISPLYYGYLGYVIHLT